MKPRITKLHGSFPSSRPFILTEEDYRTYPIKFAPLVNMVQQSLMENIFCLIGFSGNDPNFLYWTGWVRDNLGISTPPIYLCGILSLSSGERKVLENGNIIPVDLSSLFPQSKWSDPNLRQEKAMEWLLLTLMDGNPPNFIRWPDISKSSLHKTDSELPPLPPNSVMIPSKHDISPPDQLSADELIRIKQIWREYRLQYPGWVVAPQQSRDTLWAFTEHWIQPIIKSIDLLNLQDQLEIIYELCWRLNTLLFPLFNLSEIIPNIVLKINPFPQLLTLNDTKITPLMNQYKDLDWSYISKQWIELVFSLVREAREDKNEESFFNWISILEKVVTQKQDWLA